MMNEREFYDAGDEGMSPMMVAFECDKMDAKREQFNAGEVERLTRWGFIVVTTKYPVYGGDTDAFLWHNSCISLITRSFDEVEEYMAGDSYEWDGTVHYPEPQPWRG